MTPDTNRMGRGVAGNIVVTVDTLDDSISYATYPEPDGTLKCLAVAEQSVAPSRDPDPAASSSGLGPAVEPFRNPMRVAPVKAFDVVRDAVFHD